MRETVNCAVTLGTLLTVVSIGIEVPAHAASNAPVIENAHINSTTKQLEITGSNFSPSGTAPSVVFNSGSLSVASFSNNVVVANLSSVPAAGNYLLRVTNSVPQTVAFDVTVGAVGPQGPLGPAGPQGPQGPQGATGAAGAQGPTGPQGSQGPPVTFQGTWSNATTYNIGAAVFFTGSSYVSLVSSNTGQQPDTSPTQWAVLAQQGATGAVGPQGSIGPIGPQGTQGVTGATGGQGPAGPQGPQGPPVTFQGTWSNAATYNIGDAVFFTGSSYVSLVSSNTGQQPDTSPTQWAVLAQQGATGSQGPQGLAGATGAIGPAGPQGPTGAQGPPGPPGPSIYGDGSDGAIDISTNTDWTLNPPAGTLQFSSFIIESTATLTVPSGLVIRVTGLFDVQGTASIIVNPNYPLPTPFGSPLPGAGVALAAAWCSSPGIAPSALQAAKILNPGVRGGGDGASVASCQGISEPIAGGSGGGSFVVLASGGIFLGDGASISANGANGVTAASTDQPGGGGGGVIILASSSSITNFGNISAIGGNGGSNPIQAGSVGGGGGGGGIIHFLGPNASTVSCGCNVSGGAAGAGTGAGVGPAGGASGGNGGAGNFGGGPPSAGAAGLIIYDQVADPATLFP